jgi:siroheme synthase
MAVENAGRPDARALPGTLANLGATLAAAQVTGPVVLIVGEVTAQASVAQCSSETLAQTG